MTRYDVTMEMMEDIHRNIVFSERMFYSFLVLVGLILTMHPVIPFMWGLGWGFYILVEVVGDLIKK